MSQNNNSKEAFAVECKINGVPETLRFPIYILNSERSQFNIEQEYGLDADGKFSKHYIEFEKGTTERLLVDFVRSGNVKNLTDAGMVLYERPLKGNISRNLTLYDPKTGFCYTIGGVGLIKPTDDEEVFTLADPLFDQEYGAYQKERGNPFGGTQWFSEEGMKGSINVSTVGTIEYNSGPYHAVRKALENERLKELGLNCPKFIAAGPINSFSDGKFGWTIYRSYLTPEYILNMGIYIDHRGVLKDNFEIYLKSKYEQLYFLHNTIKETHGQPSVTNTLCEINVFEENDNLITQIKDFETNQPIPKNTKLIIKDGICPTPTGWVVKKSPHAGSQLYDIQLASLQDFNVVNAMINRIPDLQARFDYIINQCARILIKISNAYPICSDEQTHEAIQFALKCFHEHMQRTGDFSQFQWIISGAFAHKWFSLSDLFQGQIEIYFRKEALISRF